MNIETLRKIDYFLGVPLCFIGTVIQKITKYIFSKTSIGQPKRVLFIELSEMGSTLLADPSIQKVKKYCNAEVYFAIFERNGCSLKLLNSIPSSNIFYMPDRDLLDIAIGTVKFLYWIRKKQIDTVIDLELFSRFTALLTGFSGAEKRVGFDAFYNEGLYRGDFLTHKVSYNPHIHISKNFIALVNSLLCTSVELPYSKTVIKDDEIIVRKVHIHEEDKLRMLNSISKAYVFFDASKHSIVLFNTNSSDFIPLRRWPPENYISLAKLMLDQYKDIIILFTGEATERVGTEMIVSSVNSNRCVNFAGNTEITDLPGLYSVSALMLTNDSGPAHFASVTSMPVFVLFGPETPLLYGPMGASTYIYSGLACSPCVTAANHRKSVCTDNVCLQGITPEHVLNVLKPSLLHSKFN